MSHLITNHWLQCGVLVLQCGGVWPGPLGHHLVLIVIHWQSLSHLLYVFPQRGDGLPYQQEDYQPDEKTIVRMWWTIKCVALININYCGERIPWAPGPLEDPLLSEGFIWLIFVPHYHTNIIKWRSKHIYYTYSARSPSTQIPIWATRRSLWVCFDLVLFSSG